MTITIDHFLPGTQWGEFGLPFFTVSVKPHHTPGFVFDTLGREVRVTGREKRFLLVSNAPPPKQEDFVVGSRWRYRNSSRVVIVRERLLDGTDRAFAFVAEDGMRWSLIGCDVGYTRLHDAVETKPVEAPRASITSITCPFLDWKGAVHKFVPNKNGVCEHCHASSGQVERQVERIERQVERKLFARFEENAGVVTSMRNGEISFVADYRGCNATAPTKELALSLLWEKWKRR